MTARVGLSIDPSHGVTSGKEDEFQRSPIDFCWRDVGQSDEDRHSARGHLRYLASAAVSTDIRAVEAWLLLDEIHYALRLRGEIFLGQSDELLGHCVVHAYRVKRTSPCPCDSYFSA